MAVRYKDLMRKVQAVQAQQQEPQNPVSSQEANTFIKKWKDALKKHFDSEFNVSGHFIQDRLNDKRNSPQITIKELTFILNKFFKAKQKQLKVDVHDVKTNNGAGRGKRAAELNDNEFEWVVRSRSTNIAVTVILKRDYKKPGTAVFLLGTIIRKENFKTTKGETVFVEHVETDEDNLVLVD